MDAIEQRELVSFLVNCSKTSLSDFFLDRLSRAANLERKFKALAHDMIDNAAHVGTPGALLRDHREEIVA